MTDTKKLRFDGIEWLKKNDLYVNIWKRKMDLININ